MWQRARLLSLFCFALGVFGCSGDRLLIELSHPPGFDPALHKGTLEVSLFDLDAGGKLVSRSSVSLQSLGGEASLAEGLDLEDGRRYRFALSGEVERACSLYQDRIAGRSAPFRFSAGDGVVRVYIDCARRSSLIAAPAVRRFWHSATPVASASGAGAVLIAGGMQLENPADFVDLTKGELHDTLELFDVAQNRFRLLPAVLSRSRVWHQATAAGQGRVIITGGSTLVESAGRRSFLHLDLVESFQEGRLTQLTAMGSERSAHLALRVGDRLLVAGGLVNGKLLPTATAELYDLSSGNSLGPIANMSVPRTFAMAAPVGAGGDALVAGGLWVKDVQVTSDRFCLQGNDCGCEAPCFESVKAFPKGEGRNQGAAISVRCADGEGGAVYVIGGRHDASLDKSVAAESYADVYCYDLSAPGALRKVGALRHERAGCTASLIEAKPGGDNPRIFVAGGSNVAGELFRHGELFEAPCRCPVTLGATEQVDLAERRYGHSATVLDDGSVLIVGGLLSEASAERFVPEF